MKQTTAVAADLRQTLLVRETSVENVRIRIERTQLFLLLLYVTIKKVSKII